MPSCNTIQIVFAPLPEERDVEQSAAKEFAARAAERFRDNANGDESCTVEIHHLADWKKENLLSEPNGESNVKNTVIVFLISCGPDGSVHRSVRKTTKWIKEQKAKTKIKDDSDNTTSSTCTTAAVALLGHAVCKTSAEQMKDEVYSSGRRLAKSLQKIIVSPFQSEPSFLLETQIELESPEEKFDGWITSWVDVLTQ